MLGTELNEIGGANFDILDELDALPPNVGSA
jgi:hypothetical protein